MSSKITTVCLSILAVFCSAAPLLAGDGGDFCPRVFVTSGEYVTLGDGVDAS